MSAESMNEGYLTSQYTMIVELLEKIYADEIKIKGKVKMLSEQIACGRLLLNTEASHNEDTTPSVTPRRKVCVYSNSSHLAYDEGKS